MTPSDNKTVVRRFNTDVIQNGDRACFERLMGAGFVNRSAPPGMADDAEGMWHTFEHVLRPALSDLRVDIVDQVAEDDRVVTRKTLRGTHTGTLAGIAPTGRSIAIDVIDIVRLEHGKYVEHWGLNTLQAVLASLRGQPLSGGTS